MNPLDAAAPAADAETWYRDLRRQFVRIARRRVAADAVEDIVQDALRIVAERRREGISTSPAGGAPLLASCFQVLRNVIGNHYQKLQTERRRRDPDATIERTDPAPDPLLALSHDEAAALVRACVAELGTTDAACARYLTRLGEGLTPAELAAHEGLDVAQLYRRVYRCRLKLRTILERRGVFA